MKTLKQFILEDSGNQLDKKICDNIKSELTGRGIKVFYVETAPDPYDEYPQVYIATCDYKSFDKFSDLMKTSAVEEIVSNVGVEMIAVNKDGLQYSSKPCFEICFADTQA